MNRQELLRKVRDASRSRGAKTKLAAALRYSRQTIHSKLARDDGFTDDELVRAAAALITSEAERVLDERDATQAGELQEDVERFQAAGGLDEDLMRQCVVDVELLFKRYDVEVPARIKANTIVWMYRRRTEEYVSRDRALSIEELIEFIEKQMASPEFTGG